jgi:hypothetical protein
MILTILLDFDHPALLLLIGASFVVQDRVEVDPDTDLFGLVDQRIQVFPGSPFGGLAALLIKFTHIVEVVDVIAISFLTALALACWWDPDVVDADSLERLDDCGQTLPGACIKSVSNFSKYLWKVNVLNVLKATDGLRKAAIEFSEATHQCL